MSKDKIYLYQIGYGSYEDSASVELSHTRKIDKDEFQEMFIEATLELLLNRRENLLYKEEGVVGDHNLIFFERIYKDKEYKKTDPKRFEGQTLEEWMEECKNDPHNFDYTHFSEIYNFVADIMIELYGFVRVEYEQTAFVWGWKPIVAEHHRGSDMNHPILDKIKDEFWKRKVSKKSTES